MFIILVRRWWSPAVRGALALAFGALAIFWPGLTLLGLVLLFGGYAAADGIFAIAAAVDRGTSARRWWPLALEGALGIGVGALVWIFPATSAALALYLIALWAMATGGLELAVAVTLRRELAGELFLALSGGTSLLLGLAIALWPRAGVAIVGWLLGCYALLFGVLLIGLSLRLREAARPERRALGHA